jgi:hypothetical protein
MNDPTDSHLPNVSSPLVRLLDSPHSSTPSFAFSRHADRFGLSRNRRFIVLGAAVLSIALFLLLRDLASFSTHPDEWQQVAPPPPPPLFETVTITATVTATTFVAPEATETASIPLQVAERIEPVAFVLIAWSEDAASEAALLIKVCLLRILCSSPLTYE